MARPGWRWGAGRGGQALDQEVWHKAQGLMRLQLPFASDFLVRHCLYPDHVLLVRDEGVHVLQCCDSDCEPSAFELDVEPLSHKRFHCLGVLTRRFPVERLKSLLDFFHHFEAPLREVFGVVIEAPTDGPEESRPTARSAAPAAHAGTAALTPWHCRRGGSLERLLRLSKKTFALCAWCVARVVPWLLCVCVCCVLCAVCCVPCVLCVVCAALCATALCALCVVCCVPCSLPVVCVCNARRSFSCK